MYRLYLRLKRYHVFILFVFLEICSFWIVVKYNAFQSSTFFNTSNTFVANTLNIASSVRNFVNLQNQNNALMSENSMLRKELVKMEELKGLENQEQLKNRHLQGFDYIPAKVIKNSIFLDNNYLTINIGRNDSIEKDMGVVGPNGIVGKVVAVSGNYATIQSLLHSNYHVSSQIDKSKVIGSVTWDGESIQQAKMKFVPRHIKVSNEQVVVTSGYNAIFPEGIKIGTIKDYNLPKNESFYDINIELSTDFATLFYVYVVRNKAKEEQQILQQTGE